jgi:hypothetical protein
VDLLVHVRIVTSYLGKSSGLGRGGGYCTKIGHTKQIWEERCVIGQPRRDFSGVENTVYIRRHPWIATDGENGPKKDAMKNAPSWGASIGSLPQLAQADLLVVVLIEHLCGGEIEVLLGDVHPALAQGVHAGLGADALEFGAGAAVHLLGDLG